MAFWIRSQPPTPMFPCSCIKQKHAGYRRITKGAILPSLQREETLDRPQGYGKTCQAAPSATDHTLRSGEMYDLPCPVQVIDLAQHVYKETLGCAQIASCRKNHQRQPIRGTVDPGVQMPIERGPEVNQVNPRVPETHTLHWTSYPSIHWSNTSEHPSSQSA